MRKIILGLSLINFAAVAQTNIGHIDTTWRLMGANDKISITRFDDPQVDNVSCYVSRAEKGGISGSLGLAEDPSKFSIACRATGVPNIKGSIKDGDNVFSAKQNWIFKEVRVSRHFDKEKRVLIYTVWSTKLIDGSPQNSITAVPLQ